MTRGGDEARRAAHRRGAGSDNLQILQSIVRFCSARPAPIGGIGEK